MTTFLNTKLYASTSHSYCQNVSYLRTRHWDWSEFYEVVTSAGLSIYLYFSMLKYWTFWSCLCSVQTKADYDKECKICTRPFTVFRWRPGRDARYKKSEICQTCSKLKNVCQVCLLDLEYGLPVQVRDTALSINSNDAIPKSDVNREYFAEEHDRRVREVSTEVLLNSCNMLLFTTCILTVYMRKN